MAHQQKLVHITDLTNVASSGNQAITTNLYLAGGVYDPAVKVAPHEITCEVNGADPGTNFRWWTTSKTTSGFTFNWAGASNTPNLRIVAHVFHSICFDVSSAQPLY